MKTEGEIVLVCMPFGHVFSPSIGLSLLKAELAAHGMPARIHYFSIRFAELIGQHFYYGLSAESRPSIEDLAGEWIFSRALFGTRLGDCDYIEDILRRRVTWTTNDGASPASPALIGRILRAREHVDDFLQWCLQEIVRARPRLVGFTSMFQQHVASLALARLIKQSLPDAFVVFGGANCEDVMGAETVRQFPFVDAAVSGEADLVFPELARRVLEGRPVSGLSGVRTRDGVATEFAGRRFSTGPMVRDLDALPYPDYRDYFEQFEASRFGKSWQPSIAFETSRGCWWGEKMHCTFCGLNGQTMAFRSKTARRALEELAFLTERHPGCDVDVTDSILNMNYFRDFLPELAAWPSRPELFYEVKANLKKDQLGLLRNAGVRSIQPGIESLSDSVLKLMRKGVSALQNIQLLKWCKELGIEPSWNLLWGFPGEPPEEYHRMAKLIPLLSHLPPPGAYGMIRVDRFSPNFDQAERLGLDEITPLPPYRYVYALPSEALANLAYFFTFRYREPRDLHGYVARLARSLRSWQRASRKHDLFQVDTGECLLVWDLRPASRAPLTLLRGIDRIIYRACDSASDLRQLAEQVRGGSSDPVSQETVLQRLEPLLDRGLMVTDGSRYLSLAIPLATYSPPASSVARFYELARRLGRTVSEGWLVSSDVRPTRSDRVSFRLSRRRKSMASGRGGRRLRACQFSVNDRGDVLIRRIHDRTATKGGTDGCEEENG